MFTRKSRLRLGEISINSAKRLLQQNPPIGDVMQALRRFCHWQTVPGRGTLNAQVSTDLTQSCSENGGVPKSPSLK